VLLSDFLRKTLGVGDRASIPLEEELSLARCFLAVEQVRFGPRLAIEESIERGSEQYLVPPLLLQPLVENAVSHGIAGLPEGGSIRLEAKRENDDLAILVENAFDAESPSPRRNGLGLANVRKRLAARYGDRARIEIRAEGGRYRVGLRLPVETAP
jgi:LytS/YehU family sensor histidine kinase